MNLTGDSFKEEPGLRLETVERLGFLKAYRELQQVTGNIGRAGDWQTAQHLSDAVKMPMDTIMRLVSNFTYVLKKSKESAEI